MMRVVQPEPVCCRSRGVEGEDGTNAQGDKNDDSALPNKPPVARNENERRKVAHVNVTIYLAQIIVEDA